MNRSSEIEGMLNGFHFFWGVLLQFIWGVVGEKAKETIAIMINCTYKKKIEELGDQNTGEKEWGDKFEELINNLKISDQDFNLRIDEFSIDTVLDKIQYVNPSNQIKNAYKSHLLEGFNNIKHIIKNRLTQLIKNTYAKIHRHILTSERQIFENSIGNGVNGIFNAIQPYQPDNIGEGQQDLADYAAFCSFMTDGHGYSPEERLRIMERYETQLLQIWSLVLQGLLEPRQLMQRYKVGQIMQYKKLEEVAKQFFENEKLKCFADINKILEMVSVAAADFTDRDFPVAAHNEQQFAAYLGHAPNPDDAPLDEEIPEDRDFMPPDDLDPDDDQNK